MLTRAPTLTRALQVAAQMKAMEEAMSKPETASQMQQMASVMSNPAFMQKMQELR